MRRMQLRWWKNARFYFYTSAINGSITGIGDIAAQTIVEKNTFEDWNGWRTMKYGFIGAVIISPVLTTWFRFLERKIPSKGSQLRCGIKKMLCDQIVMSPVLNLVIMSSVGVLNKHSWSQIKEQITTQYPHVIKMNYFIWPAVQIVNFTFLPLAYQVPFIQIVAIFWNCFLSHFLYSSDTTNQN